jgi:hypothetical protein
MRLIAGLAAIIDTNRGRNGPRERSDRVKPMPTPTQAAAELQPCT